MTNDIIKNINLYKVIYGAILKNKTIYMKLSMVLAKEYQSI